ncbi:hypothetical protein ABZX40_20950 [Streptomyces sp. NPDC004610]|uniref:hypothetical protein n=1 Tax=unclassified Streptomyces TaxID=2593676 RepID=UPI0033BA5C44
MRAAAGSVLGQVRLVFRLARRLARGRALLRSTSTVFVAGLFVMAMFVVLKTLSLSGAQVADREMGRFDASVGYGSIVLPPGDDTFADELLGRVRGAGITDATVMLVVSDVQLDVTPEREVAMLEADWTSSPYPKRYALQSGRWPNRPGEVVVTETGDVRTSPGEALTVLGDVRLTVVGTADDRHADTTNLLAASGTWATLDETLAEDHPVLRAQPFLLWSHAPPEHAVDAFTTAVRTWEQREEGTRGEGTRVEDASPVADTLSLRGDRGAEGLWIEKTPAGYTVPAVLVPMGAVLLVFGLNDRHFRRTVDTLASLGLSRRTAAAGLTLAALMWSLVAATAGALAGLGTGVGARLVIAHLRQLPSGPVEGLGDPVLRLFVLIALTSLGAGLALARTRRPFAIRRPHRDIGRPSHAIRRPPRALRRPHLTDRRPQRTIRRPHLTDRRPQRTIRRPHLTDRDADTVPVTRAATRRLRSGRRLLAVAAWCATGLYAARVDSPAMAMTLAGVVTVAVLLVIPEAFALVLALLPERGPRLRLARRQLAADARRACAAIAVLTVLFGASMGFLALLDTLLRTANTQNHPDVVPGQVLLADSSSERFAPSPAVLRAAETSGVLDGHPRTEVVSVLTMSEDETITRTATRPGSHGVLLAVDSPAHAERLLGHPLDGTQTATLTDGGILVWADSPGAPTGTDARTELLLRENDEVLGRTAELPAVAVDAALTGWRAGSDGLLLRSTVREHRLPAPEHGPVMITGLTDTAARAVQQALIDAGLDARAARIHVPPAPEIPPAALLATAVALVLLVLATVLTAIRGQTRALRGYLAGLTALGLPPAWARHILLCQHGVLIIAGTLLGLVIALIPTLVIATRISGFVLSVPWGQLATLLAAIYLAAALAGTRSVLRLHTRDEW